MRRPWARGAEDIGTWQDIIDLVTVAAVITNAALIVFTMNHMLDYSQEFKYWVFIGTFIYTPQLFMIHCINDYYYCVLYIHVSL